MRPTIQTTTELREEILAVIAWDKALRERECADTSASQAEMKKLEELQVALTQRIAVLNASIIDNASAAGELANTERRAAAILQRQDQLRSQALPQIDMEKHYAVMYSIIFFWRDTVTALFLEDAASWGIQEHESKVLLGIVPALQSIQNLQNWMSRAPASTSANIARMLAVYHRALAGKVDLLRDSITPADTTGETELESQTN